VTTQDEAVCAGEFAQLFASFEGGHDPGWPVPCASNVALWRL
jgi:hypothetical protein